jgi:hypothetical protein
LVGKHLANLDAVGTDAELMQLVGMCAGAHLHGHHHAPQTAVDFDAALHDDGVGHERGAVRSAPRSGQRRSGLCFPSRVPTLIGGI